MEYNESCGVMTNVHSQILKSELKELKSEYNHLVFDTWLQLEANHEYAYQHKVV